MRRVDAFPPAQPTDASAAPRRAERSRTGGRLEARDRPAEPAEIRRYRVSSRARWRARGQRPPDVVTSAGLPSSIRTTGVSSKTRVPAASATTPSLTYAAPPDGECRRAAAEETTREACRQVAGAHRLRLEHTPSRGRASSPRRSRLVAASRAASGGRRRARCRPARTRSRSRAHDRALDVADRELDELDQRPRATSEEQREGRQVLADDGRQVAGVAAARAVADVGLLEHDDRVARRRRARSRSRVR